MKTSSLALAGILLNTFFAAATPFGLAQTPSASPLVLKGTLTKEDPFDRVRKESFHKIHEVELQKGQVYLIELESKAFDTYLRLEDGVGKLLGENDDISSTNLNSRLACLATKTGKYRVIVTSFAGGQTGPYQVSLFPLQPHRNPVVSEVRLTDKAPKFQGKYVQANTADMQAGLVYRVEVESKDFAPLIQLEQGQNLIARDQGAVGVPCRIIFAPAASSKYALPILATPAGTTGAYKLTLQAYEVQASIDPESPPTFILGQLHKSDPKDRVRKQSYAIVHEVELQAGKAFSIDLKSVDFNAFLRLEDARGKQLGADDDSGGYSDAWLSFVPAESGKFRLVVTSNKAAETGAYWLTVQTYASVERVQQRHVKELHGVASNLQGLQEYHRGAYGLALTNWIKALERWQELFPAKHYPSGHPILAISLNNLGALYKTQREYDAALKSYRTGMEMLQKLYPEKDYPRGNAALAACLKNVGSMRHAKGELDEALKYIRAALALGQKLYPETEYPDGHSYLAGCLDNLGLIYQEQGEYELALTSFRTGQEMRQKLYPEKDYPRGHADLAKSLLNLGSLLQELGEYGAALKSYRAAQKMRQALYPEKDYPNGHADLAGILGRLGSLFLAQGEVGRAENYHLTALEIVQKLHPEKNFPHGHSDLASALGNVGLLYQAQGEFGPALKYLSASMEMFRKLYPEKGYPNGQQDLATSLNNLGALYESMQENDQALKYLRAALEMRQKLFPEKEYPRGHPDWASSLTNLGAVHDAMDDFNPAQKFYLAAVEMNRKLYPKATFPRGDRRIANNLNNLGMLYHAQGDYEAALKYLRGALEMAQALYPQKDYPNGHPALVLYLGNVSMMHHVMGEDDIASKYSRQALEMNQKLTDQFAELASEAQALNFAANSPLCRDSLLSIKHATSEQQAQVYGLIWKGRSVLTRLIERRHRDLLASADPKTRALADKHADASERLQHLLLNPFKDGDRNRDLLEQLNRDKENLERKIAALLKLDRSPNSEAATPEELQAALPQGAVFIDLFRYIHYEHDPKIKGRKGRIWTARHGAFVVSKDKIQWIKLGDGLCPSI